HLARAFLLLAVAGEAHELDRGRGAPAGERAHEVGQEHEAALEHADDHELGAHGAHDLARQRLDAGGDLVLIEQLGYGRAQRLLPSTRRLARRLARLGSNGTAAPEQAHRMRRTSPANSIAQNGPPWNCAVTGSSGLSRLAAWACSA